MIRRPSFLHFPTAFFIKKKNKTLFSTSTQKKQKSPSSSFSSTSLKLHKKMLIGGKIRVMNGEDWIENLLNIKFFESCGYHRELRRNEKNMFCIDCNLCFCKHCVSSSSHCFHEWLQICKYVYHDVVRLHEIQKHLNCSEIQTYKINGEKAIHLNPRPQSKDNKTSKLKGNVTCEACGRHLQDLPNRFCSIACKVSIDANICKERQKNYISNQITKFDHSNENESCISLNESSEVIQTWCISPLKLKKNLHKRKGVPRRAPIR